MRPPQEFEKVVLTRAGYLQKWALDHKQPWTETIEPGLLCELLA